MTRDTGRPLAGTAGVVVGAVVGAAVLAAVPRWWAARAAGVDAPARRRVGMALIARGEFSIVIAGIGVAAGIEPGLGPLAAAYVLLTAMAGSVAVRLVTHSSRR